MKCAAPWKSPLLIFAAKKRKPATPAHDPFSRGGLPITKKNLATALLFCLLVLTRSLCAQIPTPSGTPAETFRDPFTVKFQFDNKHKVERRFDKTPYVSEKTIHVFPGEEFGITVRREGEEIIEVSYQPDLKKADVKFKFEVHKLGKNSMMMLTIQSYLDKMLVMEAWMLLPEYQEPVKTSLAPVLPHLMGIKTWPQPILKLELRSLRLAAAPKGLASTPQ
jgi:hypothetical protein